jgi:glycosyltransferase involved in cell wall biosynthesis
VPEINFEDPHLLSIVVPVYNSEQSLPLLAQRIEDVCRRIGKFELLLVNDYSHDGSWEVVQELARRYPWVRGISLARNYGQHNALLCGIRASRYDIVVTIDDDLQNPPEEIPKLLEHLSSGYDVVYGYPENESHGYLRNAASVITKIVLQNSMGVGTARHVSAFRAFRTQIRDAFQSYQGPFVSIDVLLTWGAARFGALPVRCDPRTIGVSNYTVAKLITHAVNMMTGFSTLPLQLASIIGFGAAVFGLLVLCYVIIRYAINGGSVPGFPFLACVISIFAGTQLFAVGIIGEYLARIHFRVMNKPSYAVFSSTDEEQSWQEKS